MNLVNKNYFFEVTAIKSGTIIIKVRTIDGLKSQYNKPKENINIHNSFF